MSFLIVFDTITIHVIIVNYNYRLTCTYHYLAVLTLKFIYSCVSNKSHANIIDRPHIKLVLCITYWSQHLCKNWILITISVFGSYVNYYHIKSFIISLKISIMGPLLSHIRYIKYIWLMVGIPIIILRGN